MIGQASAATTEVVGVLVLLYLVAIASWLQLMGKHRKDVLASRLPQLSRTLRVVGQRAWHQTDSGSEVRPSKTTDGPQERPGHDE